MTADLDAIQARADAAMPGPWTTMTDRPHFVIYGTARMCRSCHRAYDNNRRASCG